MNGSVEDEKPHRAPPASWSIFTPPASVLRRGAKARGRPQLQPVACSESYARFQLGRGDHRQGAAVRKTMCEHDVKAERL